MFVDEHTVGVLERFVTAVDDCQLPALHIELEVDAAGSVGGGEDIVEAADEKLTLAARNLPHVELLAAAAINPVSLARHDKVLATVGAVKLLEERLQ